MNDFSGYRIAAIFAHPDDEAYSCAGLLAMGAEKGAVVTVVSATRGEAGRDRENVVHPGPALARLRTVELGLSCRALGVHPPIFMDLPDGRLERNPELPVRLRDIFRRLRPNVVITLGEDGAYGHRDHLAVTDAVMRQVMSMKEGDLRQSRKSAIRPRLLLVQFPQGLFSKLRNLMGKALPDSIDPYVMETRETGIDPSDADIIMDIQRWREQKLKSIAAHRSQLKSGEPDTFLIPGLTEALLNVEMYTCPAGPPLPRDAETPLDGIETE